MGRNSLNQRLNANIWEFCEKEGGYFEVHHVKKLKDVQGKEVRKQIMIARQRKTIVLCNECRLFRTFGDASLALVYRGHVLGCSSEILGCTALLSIISQPLFDRLCCRPGRHVIRVACRGPRIKRRPLSFRHPYSAFFPASYRIGRPCPWRRGTSMRLPLSLRWM